MIKNYDKKNFFLNSDSSLYKQFQDNIYPNILYVDGFNFKSVKIEDVRNLKKIIQQSSISNKERFIVLDDVEIFNKSSLNALLKIIEDPLNKNYFFLINNKSKSIMDTIRSRSLEINIMLNEKQRIEIIDSLMSFFDQKKNFDSKSTLIMPGNYIKFNYIFSEYDISLGNQFIKNFALLLNLYKRTRILYLLILFFHC